MSTTVYARCKEGNGRGKLARAEIVPSDLEAIPMLLCWVGAGLLRGTTQPQQVQTGAGQRRRVSLPELDGDILHRRTTNVGGDVLHPTPSTPQLPVPPVRLILVLVLVFSPRVDK